MSHVKNHPLDAKEKALSAEIDAFVQGMKAKSVEDAIEQFNEEFRDYASVLPLHAPEEGVSLSTNGQVQITYGLKNQDEWPQAAPSPAPAVAAPKVTAPRG